MKKLGLVLAVLMAVAAVSAAQTTIFSDNMTNFPTGWTLSPTTGWTKVSARYYSSSYSARGDEVSPYAASQNNYMERTVSLSGYSSATLKFYIWQNTEASYDFVYADYYSGTAWTQVWSRSGSYQSWGQQSVTIPTTATKIRFRFTSDGSVTAEGAYIDNVALTATGSVTQNDAGSGGDAGNTFAAALAVSPGSWTGNYLDATDRNDYYKFNVTSGQVIKVKITPPSSADYDLYLYNPSQTQKAASERGTGLVDSVVYTADASGTWYAKAYEYSGTGYYSLLISVSGGATPNLAVSATSWSVAAGGGTSSAVSVTNSATTEVISYSVSSDQSWLTVSSSSGNTPGSFTMTAVNNTGGSRSATVTVTATAPSGTTGSPKTISVSQAAASSTAEWTIMVYLNADNNLEPDGIDDFLEMAAASYSSGKVNVIVQMDRSSSYATTYENWTTCKRFKIANGMTPIAASQISDLGEADMGNPQTLADFAKWAIANYPANRYSLVMWDHGDGWYKKKDGEIEAVKGFSNDDSHGSVIDISNGEFANALSQIKTHLGRNLDHIGWDACLMGMWEVLDISRNYANVANVSEETEGAAGWYYTTFLNNLNTTPTMSAIDLGKAIINGTSNQSTLSVVDLSQIPNLTAKANAFADSLMKARGAGYSSAIGSALTNALKFSPSYFQYHIDLVDFGRKICAQTVPAGLKNAAAACTSAVLNAVKLYKNNSTYANARGIAVYHCKIDGSNYDTRYNNLPIASGTVWDEYIKGGSSGGSSANYTKTSATYSWDASAATASGCTGDDQAVTITLPFTFNFYGTNYTSINVCSNGFLNFGTTSTAYSPAAIPNTAAPNALIAGLWRDLNPSGGGTITYYSSSTKFVVSFNAVKNYSNTSAQTFQMILTPDGKIKIQWGSITTAETYVSGVENSGGTVGTGATAASNSAALFTPPASWSSPAQDNDPNVRLNTASVPVAAMLAQNTPNPVRGKTLISFQLAQSGHTTLKIYNLNGQLVKMLVDAFQAPGYYDVSWDARDGAGHRVSAGVYLYQVINGSFRESRKMVVMK
ncbi:T9SS type A sorting domain-containing protein [candidate division TA06 bacterium]|uniref:T9SS type A sorting domain-containing protein n=1 Tax=candidate division TA06 bacterium TaxID=2250710 RepID=A0A933ICD4_UNCT6|nr:T9SS type A sorting domain-containing protein [candidate division TA06 bacterium]